MDVVIERAPTPSVAEASVEVVERKGRGHPDTLCDAMAEAAGNALARAYLDRFGTILHHNVDKVLLVGGSSAPALGGGSITAPIEIILAGRAAREVGGACIDVDGLALDAARAALRQRVPRLDVDRHVRMSARIRPGSRELVGAFMRQADTGVWLANDTSIGVGHAPLSALERTVLALERQLSGDAALREHPARGVDVKVMAVRRGEATEVTIACALIGGELADLHAYERARRALQRDAEQMAEGALVSINAADDPARGEIYLTVTGTSAESGDDGEAGRGNRANGLITPMRAMTMESVAGKNPVSHVGKIYNVVATRIAEDLVGQLEDVGEAELCLVSRIGAPVREPQLARARLWTRGRDPSELSAEVEAIVHRHLDSTAALAEELAFGRIAVL